VHPATRSTLRVCHAQRDQGIRSLSLPPACVADA
jgi:hypothetical protein